MNVVQHFLLRLVRMLLDLWCHVYGGIFFPSKRGRIPAFTQRLLLKPAHELADLIRTGEVKSETVVRAHIARIREVNPLINAIIDERFEAAIADAQRIDQEIERELSMDEEEDGSFVTSFSSDASGSTIVVTNTSAGGSSSLSGQRQRVSQLPLVGIPFSCKDSFPIKGMRCAAGLPQNKDFRPDHDAHVIANMRAAGAIPIVVGNVPEMLIWWTAENKSFGRTNNPYDLARIAGGSSGGDCALISAGGALLAVGSDIGGSIRIPCCMCGIFGHKSTRGIVSADGKIPPLLPSREAYFSMGPMARFATDLKPMLKAMAGPSIKDSLPHVDDDVDFSAVSVFYMLDDEDPFKTPVTGQVRRAILTAVQHFSSNFKSPIKQVTFPDFRSTAKIFLSALSQSGGDAMIKTIHSGCPGQLNVYTEIAKCLVRCSPHTLHILLFSLMQHIMPGRDSKWVRDGVALGQRLKQEVEDLMENKCATKQAILIMPSYPTAVPKHGTTIPQNGNISYFTILNILGLPVTQVPIGLDDKSKTPLGIQVATTAFNDHVSLAAAVQLEKVFGGWVPPAPFINHAH